MALVKPIPYNVSAVYEVEASAKIGEVDFLRYESFDSPSEALGIVKSWQHPNIKLNLSRTIYFEERGGGRSRESPINENLTLEGLERLTREGENLPSKDYFVPMEIGEARIRKAFVEAITGKPATFSIK